jgi:hypothetical protein
MLFATIGGSQGGSANFLQRLLGELRSFPGTVDVLSLRRSSGTAINAAKKENPPSLAGKKEGGRDPSAQQKFPLPHGSRQAPR